MSDRDELLRRLAREVRDHAGQYTRAFGREDNSARVLELTNEDTWHLGQRMLAVLDTGVDPGDIRFVCGMNACALPKGHSDPHQSTLAGGYRPPTEQEKP